MKKFSNIIYYNLWITFVTKTLTKFDLGVKVYDYCSTDGFDYFKLSIKPIQLLQNWNKDEDGNLNYRLFKIV